MTKTSKNRHHVVIIGAGFGGIEVANQLAGAEVDVTIIDRRNHHLFQPLLYQVAGASLSTSEIAWPIRYLFRNRPAKCWWLDHTRPCTPITFFPPCPRLVSTICSSRFIASAEAAWCALSTASRRSGDSIAKRIPTSFGADTVTS